MNHAAVISLVLPMAEGGGGFHPPSLNDFFPDPLLFAGTPFEFNRIMLVRLIAVAALCGFFLWATNRPKLVPTRRQSIAEMGFGFVKNQISVEVLGEKYGNQYNSLITLIFFTVLGMNITGIIPFLNIAGSSVVGLPLVLAIISYVGFVSAGIRAQGAGHFFKSQLFPPGVPWPLYILLTPLELFSTFIMRPLTLTVRLLANMMSGHFLLALCFAATNYLLLEATIALKGFGVLTLLGAIFFTLFEAFIAALQAYVFALLTAVYIQLSVESH